MLAQRASSQFGQLSQKTKMTNEIKNCKTCAHEKRGYCILCGFSCETQRKMPAHPCGVDLSGWQLKKPRRSLRKWLFDLFWA